jgi:hypothetical protein
MDQHLLCVWQIDRSPYHVSIHSVLIIENAVEFRQYWRMSTWLSPIGECPRGVLANVHLTFANWRLSGGCIGECPHDFRHWRKSGWRKSYWRTSGYSSDLVGFHRVPSNSDEILAGFRPIGIRQKPCRIRHRLFRSDRIRSPMNLLGCPESSCS